MAREARKMSTTGYYHIIIRGNNKSYVFKDNRDKSFFMDNLLKQQDEKLIELAAWCIMDNHVHIVIKSEEEDLALALKRINVRFAVRYHQYHHTSGHVFQDRFKSEPIETDEHLVNVVRYVHNNPVKVKMVSDASLYKWSSYEWYLKKKLNRSMGLVIEVIGKNQFKSFHHQEDYNEYLEIKEDREKLRDERFNNILALHCNKHGIVENSEIIGNNDLYEPLVKDLVKHSGYSLRKIASLLEVSYSSVQKVCSSK